MEQCYGHLSQQCKAVVVWVLRSRWVPWLLDNILETQSQDSSLVVVVHLAVRPEKSSFSAGFGAQGSLVEARGSQGMAQGFSSRFQV